MIRQLKYKYLSTFKSDFIRSAATLATGTVISQVIPLLIAPVIARLFLPADYAVLAAYGAVTLLFTIIATGMFDAAIILDHDDAQAANTGALAILITLLITALSMLVSLFFHSTIARFMGVESVAIWLYFLPVSVLLFGFSQTMTVWNNRLGRYKRLASNKVYLTVITNGISLSLGFLGFHAQGLIISLIAGQAVTFGILCAQTLRTDRNLIAHVSWAGIRRSWELHKDFPKYNMPQGFLDAFKDSGMVWIISFYFGSQALGAFSFAKSIIMRPLQVIGSSVSQVFYQRSTKLYYETGNLAGLAYKTFLSLSAIGLPFALCMFFFGESLFRVVFGNAWTEAGRLSELMVAWLLVGFVASPFGNIPLILKRQKEFFLWSLAYSLVPIVIIFIAGYSGLSLHAAVLWFSLSSLVIMTFILLWVRSITLQSTHTKATPVIHDIETVTPSTKEIH